ncbi:hypothetical protein [Pedobacter metabolipauper]|uniref:Uncharacterized protein n=1 Tax=Pedobacter metabolipauper TaxID=425513 RepID=A0A4R6SYK5_9SPHI|nr:hypothetical protein [Pedobacter metabolipauper]TDQ11516.1 hypothetical protein ATK78_0639 [Pedobacter metabolipauper]
MRNTIIIEANNVLLTDFDSKLLAPAFIESTEGGVRILFDDIDDLKNYQQSLLAGSDQTDETDQKNEIRSKLNALLNKALLDHQMVLDAIKSFAHALFSFIFKADAHRQDKIVIFNTMIEGIRETTNSWELEKSLQESTYELGVPVFNHKLTFYNYAHNQIDFNYEKIKNRLIKDLLVLSMEIQHP